MKQKIKFVKRFMSVVVVAVIVFATVAGIGNFFPNIKSEAAARQTLYICDIKSGGFRPIMQDIQDCLLMEMREM